MESQLEGIVERVLRLKAAADSQLDSETVYNSLKDVPLPNIDLEGILQPNRNSKDSAAVILERLEALPDLSGIEFSADDRVAILRAVSEREEKQKSVEQAALESIARYDATIEALEGSYSTLNDLLIKHNVTFGPREIRLREEMLTQLVRARTNKADFIATDRVAFFAHHKDTLHSYRTQLEQGKLVLTPYVAEKLDLLLTYLHRHYYVMLHGDTGSGKTELAKLAARRFLKDIQGEDHKSEFPEGLLLRCYRGMGSEEIFGHFALKSSNGSSPLEVPLQINQAIDQWNSDHPNVPSGEREQATHAITERILRETGTTVSQFILGAVYKAAQQGFPVILDEANFAPPETMVKLNEFLNLGPGDLVHIQETNLPPFRMHQGFGLICTGNIDYGGSTRYGSGRYDIEPSRLNRLTMIDYDYLPQVVTGTIEENTEPKQKQLFAIALASLLTRNGLTLPDQGIETIWRLCKYARLTQLAFSGQLDRTDENAFQSAGQSIEHRPEVLISPRTLVRILGDWRQDGFRFELDHYIYKHFIASSLKPADGALLYQLAQKQGFFATEGWNDGVIELENLPGRPFRVEDPMNRALPLRFVAEEEIIEALYGEAPSGSGLMDGSNGSLTQHERRELSQAILSFQGLKDEIAELCEEFEEQTGLSVGEP